MSSLPYRFNPRRHKRLLRLTRIKRIALVVFVVCLSFLLSTAVFITSYPNAWKFCIVGAGASIFSGYIYRLVSEALKKEHH